MYDLLKVTKKLAESIKSDYAKIGSDDLYDMDIRRHVSDDVVEDLIEWYYKVLPIIKVLERDNKINNILNDEK